MLVPITLGLCAPADAGHERLMAALASSVATALWVALVHTAVMIGCGLVIAWLVYRWLGLRFIARSWFNLEAMWAASLIVSGGVGCALAVAAPR
jgi:hypothetical protein